MKLGQNFLSEFSDSVRMGLLELYRPLISPAETVRDAMTSSSVDFPATKHPRRISMVLAVAMIALGFLLLLLAVSAASICLRVEFRPRFSMEFGKVVSAGNNGSSGFAIPHRKLLFLDAKEPYSIWGENRCSKKDLVISQQPTEPLPNGIPTYTVEITNICTTNDCHNISHIHLHCGWYSSVWIVDPHVFKRLSFDNCLVNHGRPLTSGDTIRFRYANTFPYHFSVSSMHC